MSEKVQVESTPKGGAVSAAWNGLSSKRKSLILAMVVLGFAQYVLFDVYFRLQQLPMINQYLAGNRPAEVLHGGIEYLPFDLSALVYGTLVVVAVIPVMGPNKGRTVERETLQLGNAWMLASVPLVLDNLIDTFEVKIAVIVLFIIIGVRYWKGIRNSYVSLVLSPFVAFIVAGDGFGHLQGNFCSQTRLDSCSVKAISDTYLLMIMLLLTYLTITGRNLKPRPAPLLAVILAVLLALVGLLLLP